MTDETTQHKPPYIPWTTFQTVADELRGKGVPGKFDRTAIQGKSGSTQTQYLAALRYLGMLDEEDRPTERLKTYIMNTDERPALMATIVQEKYSDAIALGTSSTSAQLTAQFREYGLEGETGRKAIAFFVNAARFANIQLSSYWPQTRPGGGGRRRATNGATKARKRARNNHQAEVATPATPATTDPKSRYIDLLLKKAGEGESLDEKLLDRIEKVLGVSDSQQASSVPATSQDEGDHTEGGDES